MTKQLKEEFSEEKKRKKRPKKRSMPLRFPSSSLVQVGGKQKRFFWRFGSMGHSDSNAHLNHLILSAIRPYCAKRNWPEQQEKLYTSQEYIQL